MDAQTSMRAAEARRYNFYPQLLKEPMKRIIFVSLLLSGCAIMSVPYVQPTDGPLASFTVQNNTEFLGYISLYEQSHECRYRKRFAGHMVTGASQSTKIKAGQEVTFELNLEGGGQYCLVNVRFFANEGFNYKFITTTAYQDGERFCGGNMYEVDDYGKIGKSVKLEYLEWRAPLNENGPFCKS